MNRPVSPREAGFGVSGANEAAAHRVRVPPFMQLRRVGGRRLGDGGNGGQGVPENRELFVRERFHRRCGADNRCDGLSAEACFGLRVDRLILEPRYDPEAVGALYVSRCQHGFDAGARRDEFVQIAELEARPRVRRPDDPNAQRIGRTDIIGKPFRPFDLAAPV